MVSAMEIPGLTPVQSSELSQRLGEGPALAALRAEAADDAARRDMPTRADRPWKYLDPASIDLSGYTPGGESSLAIDGTPVAGLTAVPFAEAAGVVQAALDQSLGSAVHYSRSKLTALHYAFAEGGVIVHTAADTEGASVRISRHARGDHQLFAPHTLIVTGANSRLSVVEDFRSGDGNIIALPVVEIVPGPGSEVRYTALHCWGEHTRVFAEQRTPTERDSAVISLNVVIGGAVVKSHIESSLLGRGSSSELFGIGVGRGAQHADFYTLQDHIGPDTRSDLLFKSALKESSRSVYYGVTRVGLAAKNADANQENRNLLLSHEAKADSDPVLEILTNDVIRVSHGATAGPVDEEQLFYLQARGIPRPIAETMLVQGFLGQVLERIPDLALREELEMLLNARMEG